jgi:hypothetical protein
MDSLTELLKKYYGYGANDELGLTESTSSDGGLGLDMGVQNQSLLGSDRRTNNTLSLMGLLGSPEALTGLGLISAGSQGKRIGESILPAFTEGLKVSSAVTAMTKEQEQQKAIDEFASQVPEQYKPLFKAFPKETMKLLLTPKTPTLSGEALKIAGKLQGLTGKDYDIAFNNLSRVERDIYSREIGSLKPIDMLLQKAYSGDKSAVDYSAGTAKGTPAPAASKEKVELEKVLNAYRKANPSESDDRLLEAIKKKKPELFKG